mgnify:CR=1 FL=1
MSKMKIERVYLWFFTFGIDNKQDSFEILAQDEYHPLFRRTPKAINDKFNAELKKRSQFGKSWQQAKQLWKSGTHDWNQIRKQLSIELAIRFIYLLARLEDEHQFSFKRLLEQLNEFEKNYLIPDC